MAKNFKPVVDLNRALQGVEVKVVEIGDRQAYKDDARAKDDVHDFPKFARLKIVDDPTGLNMDSEFKIKLRSVNGLENGQQFIIGNDGYKVVGGQLTFWSHQSTYRGKSWIFTNVSAKGDRFDAVR